MLQTVPIPAAMAYLMLRPLLPDVPDDDLCGVTVNRVFPAGDRWHPASTSASTSTSASADRRAHARAIRS